ncbi:hypothetical protein DXG01_007117 [Tephrocybe rancida]|nr:hypothetical protein DXG01_007117 [Tephrocybe rancida]
MLCQLSSRGLEHLVVAKLNRLDVYTLQPRGLQHQCTLEIRGIVTSLRTIPIPVTVSISVAHATTTDLLHLQGSSRSNLLLLLSHPDPELVFLSYTEDASGSQLTATKHLSLHEVTQRAAEFCNDVVVHPSGKVAVVSCYVGRLRVIKLKAGNYEDDFEVGLRELNLFAFSFLPLPDDEYAVAILHLDYQERVQLLARDLLLEDLELSSLPSIVLTPTSISDKIIPYIADLPLSLFPVPPQPADDDDDAEGYMGGVIVIGGRKIMMYEMASAQGQTKQRSKRRRLESKKKATDASEAEKARGKEMEREARAKKVQGSVEWPWSEVTAVCAVDPLIPRYIISDIYGRISLLSLENVKEQGLILVPVGEASPASSLTYLTNQTIYLGSHIGDSQLLQISPTPVSSLTAPTLPIPSDVKTVTPSMLSRPTTRDKGKARATDDSPPRDPTKGVVVETTGSFLNVVENFKNIAPIVDAIIVDTDGSGEQQVVTCSGGANRGSLNVVRNGAGFKELASVPGLTDVVNVWSIRDESEGIHDSHILVSTLKATHLLRINDTGGNTTLTYTKDTETSGLVINYPTLAFGSVPLATAHNSQRAVQVTNNGVRLLEYDIVFRTYQTIGEWKIVDGSEVVAADVNASQVFLALKTGRFVGLVVEDQGFRLTLDNGVKRKGPFSEISAISCAPLDPTKRFSNHLVLSYWDTKTIQIFSFTADGLVLQSTTAPLPAFARSVLLYDFGLDGIDHRYYLLAGLADGSVAYFAWKDKQLSDKKIVPLGQLPVALSACQIDGKRAVFAAGNRATVFSWEKKRLHNSPIMLRDVVTAAPLSTASFGPSLVLATPTALFIGRVQDLDKMHIRSIPLGLDNPSRITYEPNLKVFGVGIVRAVPNRIGDLQWTKSSFRLLDHITFATLANFNCEDTERLSAVATYAPEIDGKSNPVFCVGVYTETTELEPNEGRLLILSASTSEQSKISSLQFSHVATADVKGCVFAISFIKDTIIAAVNSSVMAFKLKSSDGILTLEALSAWNHNYIVSSLATYDNRIIVGDQLSSVSLLEIVDGKINNVSRDYGPIWPVAVEASDKDSILGANVRLLSLSMFSFLKKSLRSLRLDSSKNVGLEASHVFFSSSGRIGVIVEVTEPTLSLHLTALQRNLAGAIAGVGGDSHTRWIVLTFSLLHAYLRFARFRAPKNKKGRSDADPSAFGFIDGDFVEQFLTHMSSLENIEMIMTGNSDPERLTMPIEEIQAVLEHLQSFH